jgi:hypothetical protein
LVPGTLTLLDEPPLSPPFPSYRLRINKGTSQLMPGAQVCAEMSDSLPSRAGDPITVFDRVSLGFGIGSLSPNRSIEFRLILLRCNVPPRETEVGHFSIMTSQFVEQFKKNKINYFHYCVKLSPFYSLSFDLFIEHSRQAVEDVARHYLEVVQRGGNGYPGPTGVRK